MQVAILTQQISKSFNHHCVVSPVDLTIPKGQFFGLLGRNGSGKTTLLHMLATLVKPTSGAAYVAGFEVSQAPVEVRRNIGLVFQDSSLDRNLTVLENLYFAGSLWNLTRKVIQHRSDELLDLFDLKNKAQVPVSELSGGMRRALDIARGVLHRPPILLLDEPTIALDVIHRRSIWRFLEELRKVEGTTIITTTHYLEEASGCDEVVFMKHGKMIGHGQPKTLVSRIGANILEIEITDPHTYVSQFPRAWGIPLIENGRLLYYLADEKIARSALQHPLADIATAMHLRKPDLNDVYIQLNQQH